MFKYLSSFLVLVVALIVRVRAESSSSINDPPRSPHAHAKHRSRSSLVDVTQKCNDKQQEIIIHFRNGSRKVKDDDWVGLYPQGYDPSDEPTYWVHACGAHLCEHAAREGVISVAADLLPDGTYTAVLARYHYKEAYKILGESVDFTVVRDACDAPDERQ